MTLLFMISILILPPFNVCIVYAPCHAPTPKNSVLNKVNFVVKKLIMMRKIPLKLLLLEPTQIKLLLP